MTPNYLKEVGGKSITNSFGRGGTYKALAFQAHIAVKITAKKRPLVLIL